MNGLEEVIVEKLNFQKTWARAQEKEKRMEELL